MKPSMKVLFGMTVLGLAMLACSSSVSVVETPMVPPVVTEPIPTDNIVDALPQSLYFLGEDQIGVMQVFRFERDGQALNQITQEAANVLDFDVSRLTGSVVYEINNQLILLNADGSDRRVLAEGALRPAEVGAYQPVFSPDGQSIAYADGGLTLYDVPASTARLVLEDQPLGGELPPAIYSPDQFSPDGTQLLLNIGHPPDSPWTGAIYTLATQNLLQFGSDNQSVTCCSHYGGATWSTDGTSFYAPARTPDASFAGSELWKVDTTSGAVTTVIAGGAGEGDNQLIYYQAEPYLAPDGQLYLFSAKFPESAGYFKRVPAIIVRTSPNDVIQQWTVLRGDTFEMVNEALWAPDASFVLVALAPTEDVYEGGQTEIVYFDGRPNVVLTSFAKNLKWGP